MTTKKPSPETEADTQQAANDAGFSANGPVVDPSLFVVEDGRPPHGLGELPAAVQEMWDAGAPLPLVRVVLDLHAKVKAVHDKVFGPHA